MRNYYRLILGVKHSLVSECQQNNFIGVNFNIKTSLANLNNDKKIATSQELLPLYLDSHPGKTKASAWLACGTLWSVVKVFAIGDIVLCPNGQGQYLVGEITSDYHYEEFSKLPHQRSVKWLPNIIDKANMSTSLINSASSIATLANITKHSTEIENLLKEDDTIALDNEIINNEVVNFALERHLEDFLVANWANTELGKNYDIYEDENGYGQQYPCDTGIIDILALAKDRSHYLVVELKKGSASDKVVGQIQRYMGFVKEQLLEVNQSVKGVIIALDDDLRIRRALSVAPSIEFYRYQIGFKLFKNGFQ